MIKQYRITLYPITLVLTALVLPALLSAPAQSESGVSVEGIEEGATYFSPVTPQVAAPEGYSVEETTLNGEPYDQEPVSEQGFHRFEVRGADAEGNPFSSTTHFVVLDSEERGPKYTIEMTDYHMQRWGEHPHVTPTESADDGFVLGQSHGWPEDPEIPAHNLYGFQVTDPDGEDERIHIIMSDGNHPNEQTGSWGLQGAVDFLLSDDPRAEQLRREAVFFIYPMLNPDGRYALTGRSNPEMQAEGEGDHNRVWNTHGRFSTIDVYVDAMRNDTGGMVHYLLDFHSAGNTFYFVTADLADSPYAQAMTARDPEVGPNTSSGQPGMIRIWSMSAEGLNAPFAYTPEFANSETAERSLEIGRAYVLAFSDLFSEPSELAESAMAAATEVFEAEEPAFLYITRYRARVAELRDNLEQIAQPGENESHRLLMAAHQVYRSINEYANALEPGEEALEMIAEATELGEDVQLAFATWMPESVDDAAERLRETLGDPAARPNAIRERANTLAGAMGKLRKAETVERMISTAGELLDDAAEGLGRLYQNAVSGERDRLQSLLETPGTGLDSIREAERSLNERLGQYWKIGAAGPFPRIQPVEVADVPTVLEWESREDWEDGFLVNVTAEENGLSLAKRPSLAFDGDGDYVETGFHPGESTLGETFTWEFWKKYRVFRDNTGSSGVDGTSPRFYTQLTGSGGGLRTAIGNGYWTSTTLAEEDRWRHIAIVYDKGEVRTYVDGVLRDTNSNVAFSGDSETSFAIGKGYEGERWLDGYSRDHRIWSTVRDEEQLRRNKYRDLEGNEEGLVGYWPLNEGQGDTAHDRSGNGNDGTIVGASWEPHSLSGFWLSQPVSLTANGGLPEVVLDWETAGGEEGAVRVWAGLSDSGDALSEEWHRAVRGEALSLSEIAGDRDGAYLWIKHEILPGETDTPPRIERFSLEVK